jgi:hypothetical protein
MAQVGLELHPDKTRIVYCKTENRHGSHEHEQFDFLGYTFRQRPARNRTGDVFVGVSGSNGLDARDGRPEALERLRTRGPEDARGRS